MDAARPCSRRLAGLTVIALERRQVQRHAAAATNAVVYRANALCARIRLTVAVADCRRRELWDAVFAVSHHHDEHPERATDFPRCVLLESTPDARSEARLVLAESRETRHQARSSQRAARDSFDRCDQRRELGGASQLAKEDFFHRQPALARRGEFSDNSSRL
jgi:hypothetical protein